MHYELWGNSSGNRIAVTATEGEALMLVRELLEAGWSADDLSLGLETDDDVEAIALPPVLMGPALLERAFQAA